MQRGFTVDQVVHDYGDLCQAITDLAFELGIAIEIDEFRTLNRCLDNAIADAVTEFITQRDYVVADRQATVFNETLGQFSHELRNHLNTAMLAVTVIKAGNVGLTGATAAVLDRSLVGLRNLIDRSLSEVRMSSQMPLVRHLYSLADFIEEIKLSASLEADLKQCTFSVAKVDEQLAVDVDKDLLSSAIGNLLQNAFKFTRPSSNVTLTSHASGDRIHIDVADQCGGLPENQENEIFDAFTQRCDDRSGLGLGLSIARRSVEANAGTLSVRDIPGSGCVFTIDLPRYVLPKPRAAFTSTVS
jgi:signal transduction histidine kinase